jgi:hypothetical protein
VRGRPTPHLSVYADRSRLAPAGGAVVQLARFLDVGMRAPEGSRDELEGPFDHRAPRWRDDVGRADGRGAPRRGSCDHATACGDAYRVGMQERNRQNIVGIVLAVVLVVGLGLSRVLGGVMGEPGPTCDDPIAWHDAAREVGRQSAIVGPVVAASFEPDIGGAPTFLNLGSAHPEPERFDVVIYDDVRERFDRPPEQVLVGEYVCVLGEVRDRDGVPQIILDSPGWLWIEEGPLPGG